MMFSDKTEMIHHQYTNLHKTNSLKDCFRGKKMNLGKKTGRRASKQNGKYVSKSNADLLNRMMIIMIIFCVSLIKRKKLKWKKRTHIN